MNKPIEKRPETTQNPQTRDESWDVGETWVDGYIRDSYVIVALLVGLLCGVAVGILIALLR